MISVWKAEQKNRLRTEADYARGVLSDVRAAQAAADEAEAADARR